MDITWQIMVSTAAALIAGLFGGLVSALITVGHARKARVEAAYADLAAATTKLLQLSIPAKFETVDTDLAWERFASCRARILFLDGRRRCSAELEELATSLERLFSTTVDLSGEMSDEQVRTESAKQLLKDHAVVQARLESLLSVASRNRRQATVQHLSVGASDHLDTEGLERITPAS